METQYSQKWIKNNFLKIFYLVELLWGLKEILHIKSLELCLAYESSQWMLIIIIIIVYVSSVFITVFVVITSTYPLGPFQRPSVQNVLSISQEVIELQRSFGLTSPYFPRKLCLSWAQCQCFQGQEEKAGAWVLLRKLPLETASSSYFLLYLKAGLSCLWQTGVFLLHHFP